MDLHPEVPLIALLGLVHLRIPLASLVLGGAGRRDQGGVNDRALAHRHAPSSQERPYGVKDLLTKPMLLQQVAEGENRGLIGDPTGDQLDPGKAAHGGHLDQCLFHRRVAEGIPLLQQMDPQHRAQWIGRPAAFLARFGVVGFDQIDECLPGQYRLHLREKLLPFGLLFGGGEFVIREAELLTTHHPSHGVRLQAHFRADGLGFPESP